MCQFPASNSPIYESVAVVGVVDDGSGMDYATFTSDISNKDINIAMLEKLRKAEVSRLLAPYSGIRVESIILNNRRIVMNPEKKSAQQTITANRNAVTYRRSGCTKNRENIHKSMTAAEFRAFFILYTDDVSAPFQCCMFLL